MTRRALPWLNAASATVTLLLSVGVSAWVDRTSLHDVVSGPATGAGQQRPAPPASLTDAGGHRVALRHFRRIASASTVADWLLLDLAEPDRIVALTSYGAEWSSRKHLYAGRGRINDLGDIEAILALKPDLLLVNNFSDLARVARLREAGIDVFDLGEMRGLATLLPNIATVAALVGAPARGDAYASALTTRLGRVAASLGNRPRLTAAYVAATGDSFLGGALGTNYHDVITYAGLIDAAARRYRDWPQYGTEDLLELDPDVFLTQPGMGRIICHHSGLEHLRACAGAGHFIEIEGALLGDPGPSILDAAELVFKKAYGE